jgi:hypothetical protein
MKKQSYRKILAVFMALCLILPMITVILPVSRSVAKASVKSAFAAKKEANVISIMSVTGSAITYYVGGSGASNTNTGKVSTQPFSTLARATQEINLQGEGEYEIIVQGNTTETERSLIGDGTGDYDVAIHTATGSAIILRAESCTGDLITVTNDAKLVLGDTSDQFTSELLLDGGQYYGYNITMGSFLNVNDGGTLAIYPDTTLARSIDIRTNYDGYGGAIKNGGTLLMYGGVIRNNAANMGSGVYNDGLFRLYGGTIQDNFFALYGSGVYNNENATFEMYDGLISSNDSDSYAGGVANFGTFSMSGGTIDSNYANSNGGVFNGYEGTIIMTGGSITNNIADYCAAGVDNQGSFIMSGGSISRNRCTLGYFGWGSSWGGGIANYAEFRMTGGVLEENTADEGGAIYNSEDGTVNITAGTISNNTSVCGGAVYNMGELTISGSIEIPGGTGNINNIYLVSPMTIGGTLTGTNTIAVTLDNFSAGSGSQWIREAAAGLLAGNYMRFLSTRSEFKINNLGIVEYSGSPKIYYVGGTGADDTNDGLTPDKPFATLMHAFEVGNDGDTTFILQADQEITRTVNVKGNITIKSDGSERRITGSSSFSGSFLFNLDANNTLTLGNNLNNDTTDLLIIDGNHLSNILFGIYLGTMNLYSGVVIRNNNITAINNTGTFNIFGGKIYDNSDEDGIINNLGIINMRGGSIYNNTGIAIYNAIESGHSNPEDNYTGTVHMFGGTIYSNSSATGSGIYSEGNVYISKDAAFPVVNSKQDDIYLANSDSRITLEGELTTSVPILVSRFAYVEEKQILYGDGGLLKNNYKKFLLKNSDYYINDTGFIQYGNAKPTYYVNAAGSDANSGSATAPFATMERAIAEINGGVGTIILQSDITITKPVVIDGTVTLLSDGQLRTVHRGTPFDRYLDVNGRSSYTMFYIYGKLNLSNNIGGSDMAPKLVLDGGGENGISARDSIITNFGYLNISAGVILQNNVSTARNTVAVLSYGEFHMSGGVIQKITSGSEGGITVAGGTFTLDSGSIRDNDGERTGVCIASGTFVMNGGDIQGNNGAYYSGVVLTDGTVKINGGTISENTGRMAGIIAPYTGTIQIAGGNITNNTGDFAGVIANYGCSLQISGGTIGGNNTSVGYTGVYVLGSIELSGNVIVNNGDQILFFVSNNDAVIKITSPLTGEAQALEVLPLTVTNTIDDAVPTYVIGRQVLQSGNSYTFTAEDITKFKLVDTEYGINPAGKIGTRIKAEDITLSTNKIIYNGQAQTTGLTVKHGGTLLSEGIDYTTSYTDNINAGRASVRITGIGAYAGVIIKQFDIHKATIMRIQTEPPASKTFKAEQKMTPDDLLNSIGLNYITVTTNSGTNYTLPIQWNLTEGIYNPKGGTYRYTGTVNGDNNIESAGACMTVQIIVLPAEPYLRETVSIQVGSERIPAGISFYNSGSSLNVEYELPDDFGPTSEDKINLTIASKELLKQLEMEEFTALNISIPLSDALLNSDNRNRFEMNLDAELLKKAKELGKDITITIMNENGKKLYTWTFTGENLKNSTRDIVDVELTIGLKDLKEVDGVGDLYDKTNGKPENIPGLVIDFGYDGVLPAQADVRLYVGDRKGITPGSTVYLYHYNEDTEKLETLPYSSGFIVDRDGYITLHILHCSDYVMLMEEADSTWITSLKKQIGVSVDKETLYINGSKNTAKITLHLPATLEQVDSLKTKPSQDAIGGVTVSYRSSKENVATVDSKGKITAKGTGITTIYVKVKLYSGKSETFKFYITVKKSKTP